MEQFSQESHIDDVLVLPLRDMVMFPGTQTGLVFGRSMTHLAKMIRISQIIGTCLLLIAENSRQLDTDTRTSEN